MIEVRNASARGHANHGWLDSNHTFSFAGYYDPRHMGFRDLRVINEDRVAPGAGFGAHPHRDMAIFTYVLEGQLRHRDTLGNTSVIYRGDAQIMHAGKGIVHEEFNASTEEPVHFLQIWIVPNVEGIEPTYAERSFLSELEEPGVHLLLSPNGEGNSLAIHQDVRVHAVSLNNQPVRYHLQRSRFAWLQVVRGEMTVNENPLVAGDGAAIREVSELVMSSNEGAEALLFDLN